MNRLDTLRVLIDEHQCDAYLITDSDAHYTFYSLAREDRRINWITQCQAQCGLAIVTLNHGAVFQVPPNYQLLAKAEVNREIWSIVDDLFQWIRENQSKLGTIGYDPRLTPLFVMQQFEGLALNECHLRPVLSAINLVDAISNNETSPSRPMLTSIWSLDELRFAGQTSEDKVKKLRLDYLLDDNNKNFTLVTTAMDEIAWLLNLRANDMQCNPLFYSFMVVSNDQLVLFTDNPHEALPFDIRPYKDFFPFLSTLENNDVWLDDRTSNAVVDALPSPPARIARSPIQQMKEIKNEVELNGFRECHYRDCAAVCQTLQWLQESIENNVTVTEFDVIKYLEHRQQEKDYFIGIAFDTISAAGSNTALVEYAPSPDDGGKQILRDLYYLDGGANYLDGTTDMTRTVHFGEPTQKQIECYTLLLRGILAVEMTAFRSDYVITGYRIDALLQQYFNAQHYSSSHVSFGHGVSHGQGVIEGGVTISDVHSVANRVPIKPNMVVTLEPGIYLEGQWGCRIENVYVIEQDQSGWMRFVPLTLIPYSHKMIDFNLLTKQELIWIEKYHQRCLDKVNGGQWMINEINQFHPPI